MDKDPDRKARVEVELLQLIMLTHSVQIEVSFVVIWRYIDSHRKNVTDFSSLTKTIR
jgi:hypothetical protein